AVLTEPLSGDANGYSEIPCFIDGVRMAVMASARRRNNEVEITVPHYDDANTLCYEQSYVFTGFHWLSRELGVDDMERLRLDLGDQTDMYGDKYDIHHPSWHATLTYDDIQPIVEFLDVTGESDVFLNAFTRILPLNPLIPPTDENCTYQLRTDLSDAEITKVNGLLQSYARHLFLKVFPWYSDADSGVFSLTDGYSEDAITEEKLCALYRSDPDTFSDYNYLIKLSLDYGFIHYSGAFTREIRYYTGGMYPVEDGGITIWVLQQDDNNRYSYTTVPVARRRIHWDSGEDYSNEQPRPRFYTVSGSTGADAHNEDISDLLDDAAVPDAAYTTNIGPGTVELLPGGSNRWYYAIWLGNQTKKPFSRDNLYKQNSDASAIQDKDVRKIDIKNMMDNIDQVSINNVPEIYYTPVTRISNSSVDGSEVYNICGDTPVDNDALTGTVYRIIKQDAGDDDLGTISEITYFSYISRNLIHPDRAGGPVYYNIPGIMGTDEPAVYRNALPSLRRSKNTGDDYAVNVSVNSALPANLNNIVDTLANIGFDAINAGFNYSSNKSSSKMDQMVQNISGGGTADLLQIKNGGIAVTSGSRSGFVENYNVPDIADLSRYSNKTSTYGGSIGAGGVIKPKFTGSGKLKGMELNGGGGGSYSKGNSSQESGLVDINGDGLPDYISNGSITMNLGRAPWEHAGGFSGFSLNESTSKTIGASLTVGVGLNKKDFDNADYNSPFNVSVTGSLNYSSTLMETESMLIDMNGDGLPDMVTTDGNKIYIRYNMGECFQENACVFNMPGWSLDTSDKFQFSTTTDGNLLLGMFENVPLIGRLTDTGLGNMIAGQGIAIYPFGGKMDSYLNKLETTSSISVGLSAAANVGGNFSFPLFGLQINVTAGGGGGFSLGADISGASLRLMDIDGDGLPDRVMRIPGSDYLMVQRNLSGTVGLLRKIIQPQGSEYSLKYNWMPGTPDMPQGRYVLSELTKIDTGIKDRLYTAYNSARAYTVRYEYESGYYDRAMKEFYGFKLVTATSGEMQGAAFIPLGKAQTGYYNDRYYLKGMVSNAAEIDDNSGKALRKSEFMPDISPFARNKSERYETQELLQNGDPVFREIQYEYDLNYGNVTRYSEQASGCESITANITFWDDDPYNRYFNVHPREICVYGSQSGLLRRRTGEYDPQTGALRQVTQMSGAAGSANDSTSIIDWDDYGNI
ncbi:MAG: hypothetical protein FWF29_08895, partial [Treponema sp.]|nr:hypothetical protein [Treponema sp.]